MRSKISAELFEAYRKTRYHVLAAKSFELVLGRSCAPLLDLYQQTGVSTAAFMTAYNPFSEAVGPARNQAAQEDLKRFLGARDIDYIEGIGEDPSGQWPGEPSVLALGLSLDDALLVGTRFKQNAIIWIGGDGVPELKFPSRRRVYDNGAE